MYTHEWLKEHYPFERTKFRGTREITGEVSGFWRMPTERDEEVWDYCVYELEGQLVVRADVRYEGFPKDWIQTVTRTVVGDLPEGLVHLELGPVMFGYGYDEEGIDVVVPLDVAYRIVEIHAQVTELAEEYYRLSETWSSLDVP